VNLDNQHLPGRQFAKYLTAAGIAAAFGGLTIFIRARRNSYPVKVVAQVADIPVGGVKIIPYPNDEHPCFLLHPSEGTFLAFSRLRTHAACPIFYRPEAIYLCAPATAEFSRQPTAPSSRARRRSVSSASSSNCMARI
jgi:hypothetical protein